MAAVTTVFVRNLPFTATDEQLQELFGGFGEIKRSYVVRERGVREKCRGFGYVTFTKPEEAEEAIKKQIKLKGRVLSLGLADKRPPKKRSRDEEAESAPAPVAKRQKSQSKAKPPADIGRTVVLKNLSESTTQKQIYKKCKKLGQIEETTYPVEGREDGTALVKFRKHHNARQCVKKMNGCVFRGQTVAVVLASREGKTPSKASLLKSRLIVRNLSFDCSTTKLQQIFSKYGNVLEVTIPVKHGTEKTRLGCGFVQFGNLFEAAKALKEVNMKKINGRTVAVDWAVPKDKYQAAVTEMQIESKAQTDDPEIEQESDNEENDESDGEPESRDSSESESDDHESVKSAGTSAEQSEKRYQSNDASEGRTAFIRGLPFDIDQSTVKDHFSQYGAIHYCRLMVDNKTGLPRGTAFVQYKEPSGLTSCLTAASQSDGISLDDRKLKVLQAITPSEAKQVAKQAVSSKEKKPKDKRNLHLAKEGLILPGSEAAKDLLKADLVKRQKAEAEKRLKLKNPNFIVSSVRLCVRNIPLNVTDQILKDLFAKAGGVPKSSVVQVKIMRNPDRVDSSGIPRSRGFGFVQFRTHDAALKALRYTNNNPQCFGPDRRLIVEFALENQQIMKSRQQKMARQKQKFPGDKTKDQVTTNVKQRRTEKDEERKKVMKRTKDKSREDKPTKSTKRQLNRTHVSQTAGWEPVMKKAKQDRGVKAKKHIRAGVKERMKTKPAKRKVDRDEESFSKMVQNYRTKLFGGDGVLDRSRWFE